MIVGHAHPRVVKALQEAAERGTSYGAPTVVESDLAKLVRKVYPSIEKLRMVNSGTEATMSAIRAARGYTGREKSSNSSAATTATATASWSKPAVVPRPSANPTARALRPERPKIP